MYRAYMILATVALATFSYAQYQGWSMFDEAERLQRGPGQTQRHK